jgi:Protein of unknown function (DUF2490)
MRAVRRRALACVLGAALTGTTAAAQDSPDSQAWVQALAVGAVSAHWRTHVEVQPRFMNGASELGLTIVRTAVGRSVAPRVSVWLGHAWVPRALGTGVRHEQRIWQQLLLTSPAVGGWTPTARLRVEQRWLEPWQGASHRVRVLTRAQRPLGVGTQWSVFAYDEAMFTLDRTPRGPARGYDRNRLSAGLARRSSPIVSTDIGYIWENAVIPGGHRNDHVFIVVLNLSMPR